MGCLAELAVDVDVVARPTGLDLRKPDIAVALDPDHSHVEDAE
jgi:hypothetical protein